MSDLKDWALKYAKKGFKVFPIGKGSKSNQVLRSWKNEATTDTGTILKWWEQDPNYNIGIVAGAGLLVIDIDIKHDSPGFKLLKEYGTELPNTATVKTPSGGIHLYYLVKGEFKNKVNLYPGIDIRSENGYIVAPPSVIDEKQYTWITGLEQIKEANQAVYDFLEAGKEKRNGPEPFNLQETIEAGQRNDQLFKLASSMQAKGISDEAIKAALLEENRIKCNPPLEVEEVLAIVNNVRLRYSKGETEPHRVYNLDMVTMDTVEEKTPEWLINGFIPKGQITLIAGNGGVGKTTVWCNIVAAISSGKACFFDHNKIGTDPHTVMYFSSEDDIQATLKGRLRKNGADMKNILTISLDDPRFQDIKYNSQFLEYLISTHKPVLVVFDPLQSFIPSNINMGYRNAMREVLNPLIGLGMKYGVTILIMAHTNKRENAYGRNRIADSSDIWDIARSVFIVGFTGNDNMRYLSHEKSNYGIPQDTVIFSINDGVPTLCGTTPQKDQDYQSGKKFEKKSTALDEAKDFILDTLQSGEMGSKELNDLAAAMSISAVTLNRAKADLSKKNYITIKRVGSPNGKEKRKTFISLVKFPQEFEETT